jgi:hypothetical protein
MHPPKHNPNYFLTQCPLNPEASHTNVSEETPYSWQPCQRALNLGPPQESLVPAKSGRHWPNWSQPATTESGLKPRISSGTASSAIDHCATREAHKNKNRNNAKVALPSHLDRTADNGKKSQKPHPWRIFTWGKKLLLFCCKWR